MRRTILLGLSILFSSILFSQSIATDFSVDDCKGNYHNLFTELNEGKVVVIAWVMPWGSCVGPALESYQAVQGYATSNPGQVLYYMADDYANTPCSSLTSWANGNGMSGADAIFSDSEVSMSDYGTPGMPKIIVVGCSGHAVYYNANYTAAGIGDAIDEALLDCATTSIADNKFENSSFKLKLSPNPAGNNVTVSYEMNESSVVVLDIVNMTGQTVVAISNSFQNTGHNEVRVNTTSLIDGFYFLRIQSGKETQVVKFSVSH